MCGREWSAVIAVDVILGRSGMSGSARPKVARSKYESPTPVPTRIRWLSRNGKYWLVNSFRQPIDAAGELVDTDYYPVHPITKVRRLDLFRQHMYGRAYPEPRTNDHVPTINIDSRTG